MQRRRRQGNENAEQQWTERGQKVSTGKVQQFKRVRKHRNIQCSEDEHGSMDIQIINVQNMSKTMAQTRSKKNKARE